MRGLLADVNVEGHSRFLHQLLVSLDLWSILREIGIEIAVSAELGLSRELDDRALWNHCQQDGWVLFTDNRNMDDADSLQATIVDSWQDGNLPVLTLANKDKFESEAEYARQVASDIAELLFGIAHGEYCGQPRIYVPR